MATLAELKRTLKGWEAEFQAQHARKPSKDDIGQAAPEIKDLFRRYYTLKKNDGDTATESCKENKSESSGSGVWGVHLNKSISVKTYKSESSGSGVWGAHLNKRISVKTPAKEGARDDEIGSAKGPEKQQAVKRSWGIRKPAQETLLKSSSSMNKPSPAPQRPFPTQAPARAGGTEVGAEGGDEVEATSSIFALGLRAARRLRQQGRAVEEGGVDPCVAQLRSRREAAHSLHNKYKNVRLEVTEQSDAPSNANPEDRLESGHIPFESNAMSSFDEAKTLMSPQKLVTSPTSGQQEDSSLNKPGRRGRVSDELSEPPFPISQNKGGSVVPQALRDLSPTSSSEVMQTDRRFSKQRSFKEITDQANNISFENPSASSRQPSTGAKEPLSLDRNCETEGPTHRSDDALVATQLATPLRGGRGGSRKRRASEAGFEGGVGAPRGTPRARSRIVRHGVSPAAEDSDSMSFDVSWAPGKSPERLMVELDGESREEKQPSTAGTPPVPPPPAKRAKTSKARDFGPSKVSSDNFVRLNMKAKRYTRGRGGGGRTGSYYKRMAWKQKMAARSESFGSGKCFKCGQEGHWANKCKGAPRGSQASSFDDSKADMTEVRDEDFPSLSQAYNMARGIKPDPTASARATPSSNTEQAASSQIKSGRAKSENKRKRAVGEDSGEESEPGTTDWSDEETLDVVRTAYEPPPPPPPTEPLYSVGPEGEPPAAPPEVFAALSKFGFSEFREGQERAVMRVLCGLSTLVVLSTGTGKSLCYQLPAYLYAQRHGCLTLVISPLVSLMEDQVSNLPAGIRGACLHTNMTKSQREKVSELVTGGELHFLLVSPEALVGGGVGGFLATKGTRGSLPPIAFACIDEAHCLSEWSHHFRPSYLRICQILRERYGVHCLLGLTATATMVTAASVSKHLHIADYARATIRGSPVPPNLQLSASRDHDRDEALLSLLEGERFSGCSSVIVYCTRREQTDRIATLIRTRLQLDVTPAAQADAKAKKGKAGGGGGGRRRALAGDAECYHAGLTPAQRRRVQTAFMSGRLRIVVATVAFGMGLDKRDVRGVIHYNLPKSFESYVQEIGRAGRDGLPAHCHVFLDPRGEDTQELKRHIYANTVDRVTIKKLARRVFPPCHCSELADRLRAAQGGEEGANTAGGAGETAGWRRLCPGHERAFSIADNVQLLDMREEGISTLLCYLELHPKRWVENLQNVYGMCTIQCYGGPRQLLAIVKHCPPMAVAIAQQRKTGVSHAKSSKLTFSVVEVSDSMGWESGPVKRELKMLQWSFGMAGPQKTGVMVEFSDLCFHLRSAGDLSGEEVDAVVDFLTERVETQERTELAQLHHFHQTLHKVSHSQVLMCSERVDESRSQRLKESIFEYFEEQPELAHADITTLSFARERAPTETPLINAPELHCAQEDYVRGDIRAFIQLYAHEHQGMTGRAIARVLHGIPSPCFPADTWGRVRRFWRAHLQVDFNLLRKMATSELIRMK